MTVPPHRERGVEDDINLADVPGSAETIPIVEESISVSKRRRLTGRVRVSTKTEVYRAYAEAELDSNSVTVTRVPVGRIVDSLPPVRNEGATTIVPIVEERLVLVKQLFLAEELHIRQEVTRNTVRESVDLRRQHAVVERTEAEGDPT
jgi:stress response protein YsnF